MGLFRPMALEGGQLSHRSQSSQVVDGSNIATDPIEGLNCVRTVNDLVTDHFPRSMVEDPSCGSREQAW